MKLSDLIVTCYLCLQVILTLSVIYLASRTIYFVWRENASSGHEASIFKLWIRAIVKMRSIYISLLVHIFDFITDLLVIRQWFIEEETQDTEHVHTLSLAYASVSVLLFHRFISSLAVFITYEYNWKLCILQFCDVLLFVEIYKSHCKLSESIFSSSVERSMEHYLALQQKSDSIQISPTELDAFKSDIKAAVDSSMTFKYLRSLEALFEASRQAVLQLVYVMRTTTWGPVFVVSILQSIISMTNSMLNSDNAYMIGPEWKEAKRRCPIPSIKFLQHASFRMSEISSRIFMFALFWTVVGGRAFSILLACESGLVLLYNMHQLQLRLSSWEQFFLSLSYVIVLPPEWIFELHELSEHDTDYILDGFVEFVSSTCGMTYKSLRNVLDAGFSYMCIPNASYIFVVLVSPLLCVFLVLVIALWIVASSILLVVNLALTVIVLFSVLPCVFFCSNMDCCCLHTCTAPYCKRYELYPFSSLRTWIMFSELSFIVVYGVLVERYNDNYLLIFGHCLEIFIACVVGFLYVSVFYPYLMPDIRLPDNINIRSKFGYAYLSNADELNLVLKTQLDKQCATRLALFDTDKTVKEFFTTKYKQNIFNDSNFAALNRRISELEQDAHEKKQLNKEQVKDIVQRLTNCKNDLNALMTKSAQFSTPQFKHELQTHFARYMVDELENLAEKIELGKCLKYARMSKSVNKLDKLIEKKEFSFAYQVRMLSVPSKEDLDLQEKTNSDGSGVDDEEQFSDQQENVIVELEEVIYS